MSEVLGLLWPSWDIIGLKSLAERFDEGVLGSQLSHVGFLELPCSMFIKAGYTLRSYFVIFNCTKVF